jgi:hypothetical protein
MSYAWVETSIMSLIFVAAALFAVKHFLPAFYDSAWRFLARKNYQISDNHLLATTSEGACQTKCSSCNGCSKP